MPPVQQEMVIFTRTFDFLTWLVPLTNHFPRSQRFVVTKRLLDAALDLRERLEEANNRRGKSRITKLLAAEEALAKTRLYLRLAQRWEWISLRQYGHAVELLGEIGRLLGGWLKATKGSTSTALGT